MHITEIIKNEHSIDIYSAVTMAECTANDLKQEQRAYCKIRGKLGISAWKSVFRWAESTSRDSTSHL